MDDQDNKTGSGVQSPAPVAGQRIIDGLKEVAAGEVTTRPASEQPVEAIGAGREELAADLHRRADACHDLMTPGLPERDVMRLHGKEAAYRHAAEDILAALSPASPARPELTVWYGKMPESNGRENWTAVLRRVNPTDKWDQGFCFARSEYPGRVLYEADRVRWIIGERAERPDILAYDADAHSGYVEPASPARTPMGANPLARAYKPRWSCSSCGHVGAEDDASKEVDCCSMCGENSPADGPDKCRHCETEGCLCSACPECGGRYSYDEEECEKALAAVGREAVQALAAPTPMGEGAKPAAWMYSHDGMNHDDECPETITRKRWPSCKEPWTEEALYTHPAPTPMGGEVEALRGALEPFAAMATAGDQRPKDDAVWAGQDGKRITFGDFRRAAQALSASPQPEAGEASAYRVRPLKDDPEEWRLLHPEQALGFIDRKGWETQPLYTRAAPPSVQPVEGK